MAFINPFSTPKRLLSKLLCLMLAAVCFMPLLPAHASNVEDELLLSIQSTASKTPAIRPLNPAERDMTSIYSLMYDGLMTINDDYIPECYLAESVEDSNNGKIWTFRLREDIKFSDGSPVTANDVVASAQWILNKAASENAADQGYYVNLKYFVDTISAKDELTVVVKAERAYYGVLYAMTFPVVPAWAVESDNPPGTGAYTCTNFIPGNTMTLEANTNWWQLQPQVKTISVTMRQFPLEVIQDYEFARADTVFTRSIASAQYKGGVSSLALDYRTNQLECLLMNHSAFPTNSQNVREAIRCLIDADYIADMIYSGMVERTDTPFINGTWLYNDSLSAYFKNDPQRAAELLQADGWYDTNDDGLLDKPNDKDESVTLKMTLYVYEEPDNDVRVETANYIADTLNKHGFNVKVETLSFAQAQQHLGVGNFHLALVSYAMDVCPDVGFMLMNYNTGNYSRYRSDTITSLCNSLRKQVDREQYRQVAWQIQDQFAKDCPFICLFYRSGTVLTRRMYTTVRDVRELELLKGIDTFRSE